MPEYKLKDPHHYGASFFLYQYCARRKSLAESGHFPTDREMDKILLEHLASEFEWLYAHKFPSKIEIHSK
jgi:hypothetical protein